MKILSFFKRLKNKAASLQGAKPSTPAKKEPYVYVTAKGSKFHYDLLCPGIRNANEIKIPLSKARKAGYTACDKCCYSYLHD